MKVTEYIDFYFKVLSVIPNVLYLYAFVQWNTPHCI